MRGVRILLFEVYETIITSKLCTSINAGWVQLPYAMGRRQPQNERLVILTARAGNLTNTVAAMWRTLSIDTPETHYNQEQLAIGLTIEDRSPRQAMQKPRSQSLNSPSTPSCSGFWFLGRKRVRARHIEVNYEGESA